MDSSEQSMHFIHRNRNRDFFLLIFIAYASSANRLRLLISALHDPKIEVQYKYGK